MLQTHKRIVFTQVLLAGTKVLISASVAGTKVCNCAGVASIKCQGYLFHTKTL